MNWGILATGTIANKFATTVNAMAAEGERLAAVGSRRAESAKAFAAQYNIPHWHASYEELAADPTVDAIYIATPNALHYENCKLCLEHGKHVLCEKPFTINAEQAKELYALAEKKQLFIMEAFWIRFLPLYAKLQQMLADGVIGTLQTITCQYGPLKAPAASANSTLLWAVALCWILAFITLAFCRWSPASSPRTCRQKSCA